MKDKNYLKILQICDSLFPVGAFTLSNGLENYVCENEITSAQDLSEYLDSYIKILPYNELGTAFLSYKFPDINHIIKLDEIYTAVKVPAEVRKGSSKCARAFFRLSEQFGKEKNLSEYARLCGEKKVYGHQCIAYGLYMKDIDADIETALEIYGYSICSMIVTNCVKLVPLSQIAGQEVLYKNLDKIPSAVKKAVEIPLDEIGISGAGFDIHAMKHEKLYSRQFMS